MYFLLYFLPSLGYTGPKNVVLRHLVCKNLINSMLKNLDLLWKRTPKERRFPISSSCTQDDGDPVFRVLDTVVYVTRHCQCNT